MDRTNKVKNMSLFKNLRYDLYEKGQSNFLFQTSRYDQDEKGRKYVLISSFEVRPGRKDATGCPYLRLWETTRAKRDEQVSLLQTLTYDQDETGRNDVLAGRPTYCGVWRHETNVL